MLRPLNMSGFLGLFYLIFVCGCNFSPKMAPPVEANLAKELLKTTLESWKNGEEITSLAAPPHKIVVQDFDWMQNQKLVSYRIVDEGVVQDANLRIGAELMLAGSTKPKTVYYIVGTAPAQTVFRAFE
ncbi:hypothetical protein SH449x_004399 [Pirellulaceae bacterium SH449]